MPRTCGSLPAFWIRQPKKTVRCGIRKRPKAFSFARTRSSAQRLEFGVDNKSTAQSHTVERPRNTDDLRKPVSTLIVSRRSRNSGLRSALLLKTAVAETLRRTVHRVSPLRGVTFALQRVEESMYRHWHSAVNRSTAWQSCRSQRYYSCARTNGQFNEPWQRDGDTKTHVVQLGQPSFILAPSIIIYSRISPMWKDVRRFTTDFSTETQAYRTWIGVAFITSMTVRFNCEVYFWIVYRDALWISIISAAKFKSSVSILLHWPMRF